MRSRNADWVSPELSIIDKDWKTGFVEVSMQYQSILFSYKFSGILGILKPGNPKWLNITFYDVCLLFNDASTIVKVKFLC